MYHDFTTHRSEAIQVNDKYVKGTFVGSRAFEVHSREYDPAFLTELLRSKGFVDIKVMGRHAEGIPTDDSQDVTIACQRPK
jgi:hypothetical protein